MSGLLDTASGQVDLATMQQSFAVARGICVGKNTIDMQLLRHRRRTAHANAATTTGVAWKEYAFK